MEIYLSSSLRPFQVSKTKMMRYKIY